MKEFSLKFIDVMIGIILGLGFQWWPNLSAFWQYVAFVFVYLDIVDYWIDYSPSLKKFPPKRELDLIIDIAIMFSLFMYIYSTQLEIFHFFVAFIVFRVFDLIWLWRASLEYEPTHGDKLYLATWIRFNAVEATFALFLMLLLAIFSNLANIPLIILSIFILFRIITRALASFRYKKVYFA